MVYPAQYESLEHILEDVVATLEGLDAHQPVQSWFYANPYAIHQVGNLKAIWAWVAPENQDAGIDINRNMIEFNSKFGASVSAWNSGMSSFVYALGSSSYANCPVSIGIVIGATQELLESAQYQKGRLEVDILSDDLRSELEGNYKHLQYILTILNSFFSEYRNRVQILIAGLETKQAILDSIEN